MKNPDCKCVCPGQVELEAYRTVVNPLPPRPFLPASAPVIASPIGSSGRHQRNRFGLAKLASSDNGVSWRRQRDALVRDNLPLVYAIAGRMSRPGSLPFEDLSQVGSLGLLRAIEAFQPSKGRSLSSFAVPYIRGAMQHELRDRQSLMKIPRELWELQRQATVLQERHRQQQGSPLALGALARSLGCDGLKLQEALGLRQISEMRSLDAPSHLGQGADEPAAPLLESLADPASLEPQGGLRAIDLEAGAQAGDGTPANCQRRWLRQQLATLPELDQALILGHLTTNATWVELGRDLGLHPRQAQRRYQAGLSRLQAAARQWIDDQPGPAQQPAPAESQAPAQNQASAPSQAPVRSRTRVQDQNQVQGQV